MTHSTLLRSRWLLALLLGGACALSAACGDSSKTSPSDDDSARADDDGDDDDDVDAGTTGGKDGAANADRDARSSNGNADAQSDTTRDASSNGDKADAASGRDATTSTPDSSKPATPDEIAAAAKARVDNPFAGGKGYVNPEWQEKARGEPGGDRIANTPTAVWLDRRAAIEGVKGGMGLADHLDAALAQKADYAQFVIYNLPGRDCSALASNGELGPEDLPKYKAEYIDPIVAIMGDPKYKALRIINVIEVDSLPNLVTNLSVELCSKMKSNGAYVDGVAYALNRLGSLPNVYNYVDAGHHGWLGWDTNMNPSAELFAETAKKAGFQTVQGFITNTSNYSALKEPYFDANTTVGGNSVRMSKWLDWNFYADELSFAQAFRDKLVSLGFDSKIGMLIDTSRNGWGGSKRPSAKSSATDVNTFVNESRVDRRVHAGNWCNQAGAGLGERPRANPEPGIDAYVWIKPPGESDGASSEIANDEGKRFDRMCDPTYGGNERNGMSATGALADAPLSGVWFSAQFRELMQNAYPPL